MRAGTLQSASALKFGIFDFTGPFGIVDSFDTPCQGKRCASTCCCWQSQQQHRRVGGARMRQRPPVAGSRGIGGVTPVRGHGLRAATLLALFVVAVICRASMAQQPPSNAARPSILGDAIIDRTPQDFAGLPSLLNDDPYASPLLWPVDPPLGYTGPSGILPREVQQDSHFVPMEDRWRIGFPEWDRYGRGHPTLEDYPYDTGYLLNPYRQNVLKGDYPIIGQHNFLTMTATNDLLLEARQVPTPTTPFESTSHPN